VKPRSLATRAAAYTVAVTLLSLAVAFALLIVEWSSFIVEERTADLTRQVKALALELVTEQGVLKTDQVERIESLDAHARLLGASLFLTDRRGMVLRASGGVAMKTIPLSDLMQSDTPGVRTGLRSSGILSTRVLVVAAPLSGTGEWLVAAQPLSSVVMAWRHVAPSVAAAVLGSLTIAFIIGGMFGGWLVRPFERLREGAEMIAAGDPSARVTEAGDTEVVSLARAFNRMAERVEDTYRAQRAFIGDVSHELRTPITSIRGFAEALADGTAADVETVRRSGEIIRDEAERMDELSRTMLALAELDAGAVKTTIEPIDTLALADVLKRRFSATAEQFGVDLQVRIPVLPRPVGDAARLLQAASALVSNAIVYTEEDGRVVVSTESSRGRWRLVVEDDGPGVPAQSREMIFARFARADSSRSSKHGGAGLGLAIARRAVEMMGGDIYAADPVRLSGARFVIELPQSLSSEELEA
jgi:two-component system sensor histidine kinase BaeS